MKRTRWPAILAVSAKLFREKGYYATTMEDISSELKLTKPALYHYVATKQELLYAICEIAITQLIEGVREIGKTNDDVVEKLRKLVFHHANMFSLHGEFTTVYLADEGKLSEVQKAYIRSLSREFELLYRELFSRAVAEGWFRELDIPVAVRAVSGMCNWLSTWYKLDGDMTTDEIASIFFDLLLRGCLREGVEVG